MALTYPLITATLPGTAKLIIRLTLPGLRPKRVNLALISSNVSIAKAIIKPIQTNAHSEDTSLTKNDTPRNTPNSGKPGGTQLVQL